MRGTIEALLADASRQLAAITDTARLEAEVLLAQALTKPRSYLYAWPERVPEPGSGCRFRHLLERRLRGEPMAYVLGRREFWSLDLLVTPDTLIPRPETELLVELALAAVPRHSSASVADLGTGCGAIALAIARERPLARVVATDASPDALTVAERNAERLALEPTFRQGDWYEALDSERFDVIVSNPPYLAASDPHLRQGDLRFEPTAALVAGADGLAAIRTLAGGAVAHLKPGGWLLLEHGYDQGQSVPGLMRSHGFETIACHCDAAGLRRVSRGQRPAD
jgi:release factor glutamine methyltransferase